MSDDTVVLVVGGEEPEAPKVPEVLEPQTIDGGEISPSGGLPPDGEMPPGDLDMSNIDLDDIDDDGDGLLSDPKKIITVVVALVVVLGAIYGGYGYFMGDDDADDDDDDDNGDNGGNGGNGGNGMNLTVMLNITSFSDDNLDETMSVGEYIYFSCTPSAYDGTTYDWNFGDGDTSIKRNPSKSFSAAKDYHVMVTIYNGNYTADAELNLTIENPYEPSASINVISAEGLNSTVRNHTYNMPITTIQTEGTQDLLGYWTFVILDNATLTEKYNSTLDAIPSTPITASETTPGIYLDDYPDSVGITGTLTEFDKVVIAGDGAGLDLKSDDIVRLYFTPMSLMVTSATVP